MEGIRKSFSMDDITALSEDLDMQSNKQDVHKRNRPAPCATQELSRTKFVSMAEAVYRYQTDTPKRFRSTKPQKFQTVRRSGVPSLTVPQSPMLRCKARSRRVHIESRDVKEARELERKLKASPIPKSVLQGTSNLPDVSRKPVPNLRQGLTIPMPFSFLKRDKVIKKQKQERIRQQIQEERKQASQFKVLPLSAPVKRRMFVHPKVPLKPVHQTTVNRAAESEMFDQHLEQKEKEMENMKEQKEKEASLVHHATPVPMKVINEPSIPEKEDVPLTVTESPTL